MANYQETGSENVDGSSLFRFEFVEAIVRMAWAKYGGGIRTLDLCEAVQLLISECIVPNLPPAAKEDPNLFRTEKLYYEEVDDLLKSHEPILRVIYDRFRLPPP